MTLENKIETIEREAEETPEQLSLRDKLVYGARNYLIDTSAKVGCYAPIMAAMEAYNGLDGEQILQSRATAALIDVGVARVYGKTLDKTRKLFKAEKSKLRSYLVDTATMVGVYSPVYAGILAATGADAKQIGGALLMGAGIAAVTARPFGKYVLNNWRKMWGYKK